MNKTGNYYPELDGLRFLAFLLVLIHHSTFAKSIPIWGTLHTYGWIGVDLFLCLSAYLFTKLLFVEHEANGRINIPYFYLRRLFRIWPLYFFFFGIMLIYSLNLKGSQADVWVRSLGMLTFTDNLFSLANGYNGAILFSAHLWTISYEEQFYLAIPWALQVLYKMQKKTAVYALGAAMLIGMAIRAAFIFYKVRHPAIWVFPLTHFESILGGLIIGLGLFDDHLKKIPGWLLFAGGLIAFWLVSILPSVEFISWRLMLTYPLIGISASLLLFGTLKGGLGPISMLLRNKGVRYLGKISYGLYVYHFFGIYLSGNIIRDFVSPARLLLYPVVMVITTLIVTIVISALSYEILEKTFLRMKDRFTLINSRPI